MITKELILTLKNLKGIGNGTLFQLFEILKPFDFRDIRDYYDALLEISDKKSLSRFINIKLDDLHFSNDNANMIIDNSTKNEIKIISYFDNDFPENLRNIDNPPVLINVKGNNQALQNLTGVAIIGTREPSEQGFKTGKYIGKEVGSKGFNVVSGLAKGCDSSAHEGCISVGGITTAVLAHGLDHIYPKQNAQLATDIIENNGCLVSEYTIGTKPFSSFFVARDRIQSALSMGTIVIQTDVRGGTMHAVNDTLKYKKVLGAIKYVGDELSFAKTQGNQMLIKEDKAIPISKENLDEFLSKVSSSTYSIKSADMQEIMHKAVISVKAKTISFKTPLNVNPKNVSVKKVSVKKASLKNTAVKKASVKNVSQLKLDFDND